MYPAKLSVGATAHPARMSLSAEQHSLIAAAYDSAAFDVSLPAHTRAAFARKADWFRLLARVGEKKELAALLASQANRKAQEPLPNPFWFWGLQAHGDEGWQGDFYRTTH
jgi:hypothetical protein